MNDKKISIEKIPQNLHRERRKKNLSMDKLQEISGVTKQTISNIECGRHVPTGTTLIKLANGLGIKLDDLLY